MGLRTRVKYKSLVILKGSEVTSIHAASRCSTNQALVQDHESTTSRIASTNSCVGGVLSEAQVWFITSRLTSHSFLGLGDEMEVFSTCLA